MQLTFISFNYWKKKIIHKFLPVPPEPTVRSTRTTVWRALLYSSQRQRERKLQVETWYCFHQACFSYRVHKHEAEGVIIFIGFVFLSGVKSIRTWDPAALLLVSFTLRLLLYYFHVSIISLVLENNTAAFLNNGSPGQAVSPPSVTLQLSSSDLKFPYSSSS